MNLKFRPLAALVLAIATLVIASTRLPADTGTCGGALTTLPFTDVMGNTFFCQIAEAFFSGLTNGTTPTTYSPSDGVPREQMAAFITRAQDSALRRGNRRAALKQWAFPKSMDQQRLGFVTVDHPARVETDGQYLWVTNYDPGTVQQFNRDGSLVKTIAGIGHPFGVLCFGSQVFVSSDFGGVCEVETGTIFCNWSTGLGPQSMTTDGTNVWTANRSAGTLSRFQPPSTQVTTVNGFVSPVGILFDGTNIWVNDVGDGMLKKLDSNGNVIASYSAGGGVDGFPVYDGFNIWLPDFSSNAVGVVRARDGMLLARLTGNGLSGPVQAAFDGERILITNFVGNSVSIWKAADLTAIGTIPTAAGADGDCSDGTYFYVVAYAGSKLLRF